MRRAGRIALVFVAAAIALTWLALPAGAVTRWIAEQGKPGKPFTLEASPAAIEVVETADDGQDLRLAVTAVERINNTSDVYGGSTPDPRSIQVLSNGHLLFADRNMGLIAETTRSGGEVWSYSRADHPELGQPFSAQRFVRDGRQLTLITDRRENNAGLGGFRVFAVDQAGTVVWQYGVTGERGSGVNHLVDPFYASYSADEDTVVIADCNGGNRVIEVMYGVYQAGEDNSGFDELSIVWSYGTAGSAGTGPGQLVQPHSAERLDSGNVLICDASPARVIEVRRADKEIIWKFGVANEPGSGPDHLSDPNHATRLSDGDTLIADTGNQRVLRVNGDAKIVRSFDTQHMGAPPGFDGTSEPRQAACASDGLLAVADNVFQQIVMLGYQSEATVTSLPLDCGHPGVDKAFDSLTWDGYTGASGTKVARVDYKVGNGSWKPCKFRNGFRRYDFPGGTHGVTIAYRVTLSTSDRSFTPTLLAIIIQSHKAKTGGGDLGGGGDTGGSGNSGQSGTYTYPSTAQGGTGTSGTGTGSGSSGSGTGSGSSGTGTGSSGIGAGSSSVAESVEVPVQSTGSGDAQAVQGYQVQGEEGVSGVPLRAEEGAQAPEPDRPGPAVPVLALVVAGLVVAAAFFVPWPFVAAHLRHITGFDHTRPARFLPFRPLGK